MDFVQHKKEARTDEELLEIVFHLCVGRLFSNILEMLILSLMFGFNHQTLKLEIFTIQLLKSFTSDHLF